MLDATFWNSRIPFVTRSTRRLRLRGYSQAPGGPSPGPGSKKRRIRLAILAIGRDLAMVNLAFKVRGHDLNGRQSQTSVRYLEHGWKVVAAPGLDSEREVVLVNPTADDH